MTQIWRGSIGVAAVLSLAACTGLSPQRDIGAVAGLTQIQDTISKFDQGAHSISTSETAFLRSAQTADCNYQFYTAAFVFANDPDRIPKISLTLETPCTPNVITPHQLEERQKLMEAIVLYADQIQAVASSGSDKALSANSKSTAAELNSLAKSQNLMTGTGSSIVTDLGQAVAGLTAIVLAPQQLSDIKTAAASEAENLSIVVNYLKQENTALASDMAGKTGALADILDTTLAKEKRAGDPNLLLDAVYARSILQNGDADPVNTTKQLNVTLDSLVAANEAIANAGTGGIVADVNALIAQAQAIQKTQAALNK